MAYRASIIILTLSFMVILNKYWRAKDEKDSCYVNLDKHVKYIKEIQTEAEEDKNTFERNMRQQEQELDGLRKEKINAESKFRLCDNQNENQMKDLRYSCRNVKMEMVFIMQYLAVTLKHNIYILHLLELELRMSR